MATVAGAFLLANRMNDRGDAIKRVVNDSLQTFPIFAYLVPVIRLTNLEIQQVDTELIESATNVSH